MPQFSIFFLCHLEAFCYNVCYCFLPSSTAPALFWYKLYRYAFCEFKLWWVLKCQSSFRRQIIKYHLYNWINVINLALVWVVNHAFERYDRRHLSKLLSIRPNSRLCECNVKFAWQWIWISYTHACIIKYSKPIIHQTIKSFICLNFHPLQSFITVIYSVSKFGLQQHWGGLHECTIPIIYWSTVVYWVGFKCWYTLDNMTSQ